MGTLDPVGAVRGLRQLTQADRAGILGGAAAKLLKL
jgi:hypothetical protein